MIRTLCTVRYNQPHLVGRFGSCCWYVCTLRSRGC